MMARCSRASASARKVFWMMLSGAGGGFGALGRIVSAITVRGQLLHYFVPSLLMVTIKNSPRSPAGYVLQTGISHSQPTTMPKPSMKISIAAQLARNPTFLHTTFVALQFVC